MSAGAVGLSTAGARRLLPTLAIALGIASVGMTGFAVFVTATTNGGVGEVGSIVLGFGLGLMGALVAYRRPHHPIGWLLLFIAVTQSFTEFASSYASFALVFHPHSWPGGALASWFGAWMWVPGLGVLVTLLFLLFPTGRLPSQRWRVVAIVASVALVLAATVLAAGTWAHRGTGRLEPGTPVGSLSPLAQNLFGLLLLVLGACMVASLLSLFVRYRRSSSEERHQLKWVAYATVLLATALVIDFQFLPIPLAVKDAIVALGVVAFPVSLGVAILKFRLYDIDVVISRTLMYGALAALITGVYVGIAVGIGTLVGSGGKPNLGLSILATGVVAVGFQPVRERLQKVANRLVYGKRATPYEVLSQFSERVAESYASDEVLPRMAQVLAEGTNADLAEVWLRRGDALHRAAVFPLQPSVAAAVQLNGTAALAIPAADRSVVVRHQGGVLGALSVTKRRGESITPIEIKLMDDLAHQAGLVLRNVGLTSDLQGRLVDLRASRQRLVAAQDDERRRLERNLHDGAQQYLVAIKVKLGLVEMLATRDPEKARATLIALKGDADEALATLRDLARGIYPPLLAEKGLTAALQSQAAKATLPVHVDADGVGRYPQETEAALYFCTLEALQNVQKYAAASAVAVRLREERNHLFVEVRDDGRGFDVTTATRGAGLTNMEDRLDALGGTLEIESTLGVGTTLRATVPVSQVAPAAAASNARLATLEVPESV
jgi:signal transduction histidine kinase